MMAAITPYPRYSGFQHTSFSELVSKRHDVLETLLPLPEHRYIGPQVAVFIVTSSAGGYTLLLANAISFLPLINSCDTLYEICPVIFEHSSRSCTAELLQAIRTYGTSIPGTPELVALQIDPDTRGRVFRYLSPSYSGNEPQAELIRLISGQVNEIYIGSYRLIRMGNSWTPPAAHPGWQGMAFEQRDRLIQTWIHEANPNALQRAKDEAQQQIDRTQAKLNQKIQEIQQQTNAGRYAGALKERLDREHTDLTQTLQEHQNQLAYLTAQTVNSASKTTLQCAITMQIDQEEKIQRLEHYVCQGIVSVIDRALEQTSWENLQIGTEAIDNFVRQKLTALETRIPLLIERGRGTITDWRHFRDQVMPRKGLWVRENFEDFCQEKVGHRVPTPLERPELEKMWKTKLSEKLRWVTDYLNNADRDLKLSQLDAFTSVDVQIFETHRERMAQVLRRGGQMTYSLGEELTERYRERDTIRQAIRDHQWVHLVKRVATTGAVHYGVVRPPASPQDRPDPNSDLNEVHIPMVVNAPAIYYPPVQNRQPPQPHSSSRTWKWILGGSALVLGVALIANRLFFHDPIEN